MKPTSQTLSPRASQMLSTSTFDLLLWDGMGWDGMGWMGWDGMGWDGMGWDGMGWDGMGWDGMGWDGMGWDGMGWDGMGWDGMGWDGMGWDGMGWDGMGWDGMGWDGMGWDGMGWDTINSYVTDKSHAAFSNLQTIFTYSFFGNFIYFFVNREIRDTCVHASTKFPIHSMATKTGLTDRANVHTPV